MHIIGFKNGDSVYNIDVDKRGRGTARLLIK